MPQMREFHAGMEIERNHEGHRWVLLAESAQRFRLYRIDVSGDRELRGTYGSMTAAAQVVRGNDRAVNGWDFFGVRNPAARRRAGSSSGRRQRTEEPRIKISGKCKHQGCYEPADCKHGLCAQHCQQHAIGSYTDRRYPRTPEPHMGMEIEVEYASSEDFRRGVGITCHRDGSLGSYGAEYKLLARSDEIAEEAAELVEQLWKRRARVNRRCGLHVHLDVRQVDATRRRKAIEWLARTEEVWFSLMPPSRRTSSFVQRLTGGYGSHYSWANLSPYNTLEIRLHGGSLNPFKVVGWLAALKHLQAKILDATYEFPSSGIAEQDFWALFEGCTDEGKEYLMARRAADGQLRDRAYSQISGNEE